MNARIFKSILVFAFLSVALVRVLVDGWRGEGAHEEVWDGRDERRGVVASGVYFARL